MSAGAEEKQWEAGKPNADFLERQEMEVEEWDTFN